MYLYIYIYNIYICIIYIYTSSTAQGGGGNFKNRKPIEEIGCFESGWRSEATDGPTGG